MICLFYNNTNIILSSIIEQTDVNILDNDINMNIINLQKISMFNIKYYIDILINIYNSIEILDGKLNIINKFNFDNYQKIQENKIFKPILSIIKELLCGYYKLYIKNW